MLLGNATRALMLLYILLMSNLAYCFKCYQCRSDTTTLCDLKVSSAYLKDCVEPGKPESPAASSPAASSPAGSGEGSRKKRDGNGNVTFYCRKILQTLYVRKSQAPVMIRECTTSYGGEECSNLQNKLIKLNVCDCKKEACNASDTIHYSDAIAWMAVLVFIVNVLFL